MLLLTVTFYTHWNSDDARNEENNGTDGAIVVIDRRWDGDLVGIAG
jgi:hypothetical protein